MKTNGILLIAFLALLLHDASCAIFKCCFGTDKDHDETPLPDGTLPDGNIDNYVFEKSLGNGTSAEVILAKHKETKKEVAIKIIDTTKLNDTDIEMLKNEIPIMIKLNHPNVLKMFGSTKRGKIVYLVLEYASGGDLLEYMINNGILDEKFARRIFRQMIEAVDYCHYMKVAHRDLKPENFLLDKKDNIKLADFGFAVECEPGEILKTFPGSPEYTAPEILQNKPYDGHKADVWSLGVILYTLMTASIPKFNKDGTYNVPSYVSQDCKDLMASFLQVDPGKRPFLRDIILKKPNVWLNKGFKRNILKPYDKKRTR